MAELVIALVTLVILIVGTTTFAQLAISQILLRRDVRATAGQKALNRSTDGWTETDDKLDSRISTAHQINAYTQLRTFSPALDSHLPASNYTLDARNYPNGELGLRTTEKKKIIHLDNAFITLIHDKRSYKSETEEVDAATIRLRESVTYPATDNLWPNANDY